MTLLVQQPRDGPGQLGSRRAQGVRDIPDQVFVFLQADIGAETCKSFNSPNSRSDARLSDDFEHADVAGHLRVRSAAQLHTDFGYRHDANLLLVFLAEESERAFADSLVDFHDFGFDRDVAEDNPIDLFLDLFDLALGKRREMGVIETETVWCDERSCLFHVSAERLAQYGMKNMRARMVRGDAGTAVFIDLRLNLVASPKLSIFHLDLVNDDTTNRSIGFRHSRNASGRCERSGIADLSAGFGIE